MVYIELLGDKHTVILFIVISCYMSLLNEIAY